MEFHMLESPVLLQSLLLILSNPTLLIRLVTPSYLCDHSQEQLKRLAITGRQFQMTATRNIAHVVASGGHGTTTVSATMFFAHKAGIPFFVTGGIGGMHRHGEQTMDISSDLTELGKTPVAVISAGVKSILDIPRTLEFLETQRVTVAAYRTNKLPAFLTEISGSQMPCRVDSPEECAKIIHANKNLHLGSGILIAVPIPKQNAASGSVIESAIQKALKEAEDKRIIGNTITAFMLERVKELTGGSSLEANIALLKNKALLGVEITVTLSNLEQKKKKKKKTDLGDLYCRSAFEDIRALLNDYYSFVRRIYQKNSSGQAKATRSELKTGQSHSAVAHDVSEAKLRLVLSSCAVTVYISR